MTSRWRVDGWPMKKKSASTERIARDDQALVDAARVARERAHAPWSRFKVGAAARFGDEIVHGCNVEFDVYGLTNCAERTAVFAAFANGAARKPMTAMAVIADTPDPVSPCGACRQVMFECGGADLRVILANTRGDARVVRMADLLPGGFQLETQIPTPPDTPAPARKRALRRPTRNRRGKQGSIE
jgi:cytidine deaminase